MMCHLVKDGVLVFGRFLRHMSASAGKHVLYCIARSRLGKFLERARTCATWWPGALRSFLAGDAIHQHKPHESRACYIASTRTCLVLSVRWMHELEQDSR